MKLKTICIAGALAILSLWRLPAANAAPTTFAQFLQTNNSVKAFTYNDTGATSSFNVVSIPVKSAFGVTNSYNGNNFTNPIDAHLTMTAVIDGNKPTGHFFENFQSVSMVFTADTPVGGMSNLLTMTATAKFAPDTGFNGSGNHATLTGDTVSGDVVNYSSDFLFFFLTTDRDFALSFSGVDPKLSLDVDGWLNSFAASGTGTFASEPAPFFTPDGTSVSLLSGGLLPLAGQFGRA